MTKKIGRHSLAHEPAFHRLDSPVTEAFDCGQNPHNAFLLEHAWQDQQHQLSVTYIAHVGDSGNGGDEPCGLDLPHGLNRLRHILHAC
jgi:hypothetical protein